MAAPEDEPGKGVGPTHELADAMSRTARRLQEEHGDVEGTLQAVTAAAVQVVPHAEECSISYVIGRSKVEPRASTSDLPRELDALQVRLAQGPCMDAVWEQEVVRVDDLAAEDRWPEFARQASERGVGSMICYQLLVQGDQLGALTCTRAGQVPSTRRARTSGTCSPPTPRWRSPARSTRRTCGRR